MYSLVWLKNKLKTNMFLIIYVISILRFGVGN